MRVDTITCVVCVFFHKSAHCAVVGRPWLFGSSDVERTRLITINLASRLVFLDVNEECTQQLP